MATKSDSKSETKEEDLKPAYIKSITMTLHVRSVLPDGSPLNFQSKESMNVPTEEKSGDPMTEKELHKRYTILKNKVNMIVGEDWTKPQFNLENYFI